MNQDAQPNARPRYGDFPELFWDAVPDEHVDTTNPVVLSRLLRYGTIETVAALVRPGELASRLDHLSIPEHTRTFWRLVLAGIPASSPAEDAGGQAQEP